ncbi:hypothetical protein I307_01704 [Cryptococcus deuterogattii 99/473]|uniref:Protein SYM1 n=2 Tax=Cryptococcus deuterogattii TaxID=1859096 RepID=A0A0D0UXS8_9TREE|nr:hypothetical protein CNBG_4638 [Cryptococcus deuterogattii R265]KIR25216.1 hypothetical protein I309_05975 [Cryptococcus deuterogattii LA55]KIR36586.1 hypothetical protein I352_01544 [Cryptococcus deuterogattii MMRL2647]KIR38989.1 hypothetical protein I313_05138 [Cryptococcus deuterogattii Ram5]KIR76016.1 hypothetical protein I310_00723 [Cryptococcus deuterogattii CA1014]KIR95959.1 hypothetical protein I304_00724 [Cryptococcus deuterogattii CBS 10090]KIS02455.1 hypothetical protein L804_00
MSTIARPITSRLWNRYTTALRERPLRTKMIQSGVLFIAADIVAQFGIEGKSLRSAISGEEGDEVYEPLRTARLASYGTFVFAPLAHIWLSMLERISLSNRWTSLASKVILDMTVWSPCVTFMFPTSLGLLEGKSIKEVRHKVAMGWFPTWQKAVCVFGPTQVLNFTLVPAQHRLLFVQSVGTCWNTFLSWQNNRNNKILAIATLKLAEARVHALEVESGEHPEEKEIEQAEREVEKAQATLRKAEEKKERMRKEGGEAGVGVRMGWS